MRAAEQKRAEVAQARRRWMLEQGLFDPARLVFVDETATSTSMARPAGGDAAPETANGSFRGLAQESFELGKGQFDWVEVGRVFGG
jgi:hypothetical protein